MGKELRSEHVGVRRPPDREKGRHETRRQGNRSGSPCLLFSLSPCLLHSSLLRSRSAFVTCSNVWVLNTSSFSSQAAPGHVNPYLVNAISSMACASGLMTSLTPGPWRACSGSNRCPADADCVDFDHRAVFGSRLQDCFEVHLVGIALQINRPVAWPSIVTRGWLTARTIAVSFLPVSG